MYEFFFSIILLIILSLAAVVGINGIFSNLDLGWYATSQCLDLSTDLIIVDGPSGFKEGRAKRDH